LGHPPPEALGLGLFERRISACRPGSLMTITDWVPPRVRISSASFSSSSKRPHGVVNSADVQNPRNVGGDPPGLAIADDDAHCRTVEVEHSKACITLDCSNSLSLRCRAHGAAELLHRRVAELASWLAECV
jgi:hypothetical protein